MTVLEFMLNIFFFSFHCYYVNFMSAKSVFVQKLTAKHHEVEASYVSLRDEIKKLTTEG